MEKLINNQSFCEIIGKNAFKEIEQKFKWDLCIAKYIKIMNQAIKSASVKN